MKIRAINLTVYLLLMILPASLFGQKDSSIERVKRKNTNDSVRILGALESLIMARFNNIPHKAILDTGIKRFCIMSKNMADHIGVKCDTFDSAYRAIMDSIEIGNITLYNIPVKIEPSFPDSSSVCLTSPITVGIPLMQLIGKLLVDNENEKITFPVCNDTAYSPKEPNLFIHHDLLYTHLKINENEFTGFLGTGADVFLGIDTTYYEKYKNDIKLDTITALIPYDFVTSNRALVNISYTIPYNPMIKSEDRIVRVFKKRSVMIYSLSSVLPIEYFDGLIGYHCFKRLGKKGFVRF